MLWSVVSWVKCFKRCSWGHSCRGRVSTRVYEKTDAPAQMRKSTRQVSGTSIFINRRFRDLTWPRKPATVAVDGEQPLDERHQVPHFPRLG